MAWGQYRTITIDKDLCGVADSSNFPILVAGIYPYLKTTANGGKVENASGYDNAFFSDSGLTTMLDFERVSWSATTGAVEFWVRVPTLDVDADTVIYMAYGNAAIETDQQSQNGTWNTSFKGVWHMNEDPSGGAPQLIDSTSTNADGTSGGTMLTADLVTGAFGGGTLGKAIDFDGSDDYFDCGINSALMFQTSVSLSVWVKPGRITEQSFFNQGDLLGDGATYGLGTKTNKQWFFILNGGTIKLSTGDATQDVWQHMVYTFNPATDASIFYLNASTNGTTDFTGAPPDSTGEKFFIGQLVYGEVPGVDSYLGIMDEVRVYSGILTPSWITAEYNNQNNPSTFYAVGDEVPIGGSTVYRSKIGLTGVGNS